jgi:hypothetical protein
MNSITVSINSFGPASSLEGRCALDGERIVPSGDDTWRWIQRVEVDHERTLEGETYRPPRETILDFPSEAILEGPVCLEVDDARALEGERIVPLGRRYLTVMSSIVSRRGRCASVGRGRIVPLGRRYLTLIYVQFKSECTSLTNLAFDPYPSPLCGNKIL